MKLISIIGARPQFVKVAPIVRAVERRAARGHADLEHLLVHTGQHYDAAMSDVFFGDLDLPAAHCNLDVGSGTHGAQTGLMLARLEHVLLDEKPDVVLVYGDTNSTLAGALASAKLHIPVAHVEAGLRSFNRLMPEEINRRVADHVSDLLLAPTTTAMKNLQAEGLGPLAVLSGDVMYDAVLQHREVAATRSAIGQRLGLGRNGYAVVTVHRAENTECLDRLGSLLAALNQIAEGGLQLVFPMHPRTLARIRSEFGGWMAHRNLRLVDPARYLDMLWLIDNALMTLTDSGGVQKEAFFLGCPCITLRDETEWVETVELGGNVVVGTDTSRILAAVAGWREQGREPAIRSSEEHGEPFGGGEASHKILAAVVELGGAVASYHPRSRASGDPQRTMS